jgi:hypothetical protein
VQRAPRRPISPAQMGPHVCGRELGVDLVVDSPCEAVVAPGDCNRREQSDLMSITMASRHLFSSSQGCSRSGRSPHQLCAESAPGGTIAFDRRPSRRRASASATRHSPRRRTSSVRSTIAFPQTRTRFAPPIQPADAGPPRSAVPTYRCDSAHRWLGPAYGEIQGPAHDRIQQREWVPADFCNGDIGITHVGAARRSLPDDERTHRRPGGRSRSR